MKDEEGSRTCFKRNKSVVVRTDTDENSREFVIECLGKTSACVGLGCMFAELGGEWPFKEDR